MINIKFFDKDGAEVKEWLENGCQVLNGRYRRWRDGRPPERLVEGKWVPESQGEKQAS